MRLRKFLVPSLLLLLCGCATPPLPPQVVYSPPTEKDAVPITDTRIHTKTDAKADLGAPHTVLDLPADKSPCRERWYYLGKAQMPDGSPISVMMYVDFDAAGNACQAPHA
jgi:hypothetical protein